MRVVVETYYYSGAKGADAVAPQWLKRGLRDVLKASEKHLEKGDKRDIQITMQLAFVSEVAKIYQDRVDGKLNADQMRDRLISDSMVLLLEAVGAPWSESQIRERLGGLVATAHEISGNHDSAGAQGKPVDGIKGPVDFASFKVAEILGINKKTVYNQKKATTSTRPDLKYDRREIALWLLEWGFGFSPEVCSGISNVLCEHQVVSLDLSYVVPLSERE